MTTASDQRVARTQRAVIWAPSQQAPAATGMIGLISWVMRRSSRRRDSGNDRREKVGREDHQQHSALENRRAAGSERDRRDEKGEHQKDRRHDVDTERELPAGDKRDDGHRRNRESDAR